MLLVRVIMELCIVVNLLMAIKKILNNVGQAEKEFQVEVEAIGHVRHKNLVRLLGYCIEGTHRRIYCHADSSGAVDKGHRLAKVRAQTVENVVENESHFSLDIVDQDLSSLAMFTRKHLHCEQRKRVVRSQMKEEDGLGGNGFVVDGVRSPSISSKDREESRVENKSSMGSRFKSTRMRCAWMAD
ncbi:probable receptor-like protein kinase [Tanacetum coccineum]